jgi:hypothetical protein
MAHSVISLLRSNRAIEGVGTRTGHHAQMVKDGVLKILFHVEESYFHADPSVPSIYKFAKPISRSRCCASCSRRLNSGGLMWRRPVRRPSAHGPFLLAIT